MVEENIGTGRMKVEDGIEYERSENESTSFTTIESLPTELLTHILEYLPPTDRLRSEQVCEKWRNASRETWRDIQTLYIIKPDQQIYYYRFKDCAKSQQLVSKEGNNLYIGTDSPKIIHCLLSRIGGFLKTLVFDHCPSKNHRAILSIISHYCRNLKILELSKIENCEEKVFSKLFELNKELHSVRCRYSKNCIEALPLKDWKSLRLMSEQRSRFCEGKIISLIESSESLEEFQTYEFTEGIMEAVLKRPNLKSLYFTPFSEGSLQLIFHIPLLNRLTSLMIEYVELDSQLLSSLLQHCCNLKRLVIVWHSIPEILLEAILALPNLQTLELQCGSIEDDILIRLTRFKNLLLEDALNSATNNGILQMIKKSEVLEKLAIYETGVTPEMFKELVEATRNRRKRLEIVVPYEILDEVSEICANSKICVVRDLQCFRHRTE